jgi:hypothetical protein
MGRFEGKSVMSGAGNGIGLAYAEASQKRALASSDVEYGVRLAEGCIRVT